MKILQINAVYGTGSTGKMVRDISDKLIEMGHQSYIMWAINCQKKDSKAKFTRIGNTIDHKLHALLRRLDGGQGMHSKLSTKIACKKILDISPDVVHLHNLHSNYIHLPTLFEFLAKYDIPTLITMHDCWYVGGYCTHYLNHNCKQWLDGCADCPAVVGVWLKRRVKKAFAERQRLFKSLKRLAINGVSCWTTETARRSMLNTAAYIECIYNFVDTDLYKPRDNAIEVRKRYGISPNRKMVFGVSQSWSKEKGADAFVLLADKLLDIADIILVGENNGVPERENLRCIGYVDNVEELIELYSAADVLVNASSAETFGLVTVEAMACGTPVVAYNNSGSSELIPQDCGVLVEDGNKQALIDGVTDLLSMDKKVFASACREHVCNNFKKDKQTQEYIELYKKISCSGHLDVGKEN